MNSPKKDFQLETDSHIITTTYQPSHIDFRVIDKRTNCIKNGKFYDFSLPQNVKQECQAVADLFEYLQGRSASEVYVEGNIFKFKVVRIKKERWYSLEIEDQIQSDFQIKAQEKHEEKMEIEVQDPLKAVIQMNESLKQQNLLLRYEVQRLNAAIQALQQKNTNQNTFIEHLSQKMEDKNEAEEVKQEQPIQRQLIPQIRKLILQKTFQSDHYKKQNGVIQKVSAQLKSLMFRECIKKDQKWYFSIELLGTFYKNWIIFGVMTKQREYQKNFLMLNGCIAYSGSIGNIFVERDTIDINRKLGKGDRIRLQIDCIERKVEWLINDALVYKHLMKLQMSEKNLYPFLVLSSIGNAVRINCDP